MNTEPHNGDIFTLCNIVRETSFEIYKYLRSGHREQIYENALAHRLRKRGIKVHQQQTVKVFDEDGTLLGFLRADLLINNQLFVRLKGVTRCCLNTNHSCSVIYAQLESSMDC